MTITLTDLPAATDAYLRDHVEVRVARVTENLQPGEEGTLSVRWTNASAPTGVRLRDVVLHVSSSNTSVALLKVPSQTLLQTRTVNDITAPAPAAGTRVGTMFVFLPTAAGFEDVDATLDVGEVSELEFGYRAEGAGGVTFSAHVHAAIEVEDLFPRGPGDDGTRTVRVLPS